MGKKQSKLIYIDTNYILRYFLVDIPEQKLVVSLLFDKATCGLVKLFTSELTIFESVWVAKSIYRFTKTDLVNLVEDILSLKFIEIPNRILLGKALNLFRSSGLNFNDCYHLVYIDYVKCDVLGTFDKKLQKVFQRMRVASPKEKKR